MTTAIDVDIDIPLLSPLQPAGFEARRQALQARVDEISQKMGIPNLSRVQFLPKKDKRLDFDSAFATSKGISAPDYFLIRPEDVPTHLRLDGFDDPRLKSDKYLNSLLDWMADTLQLSISPLNRSSLKQRVPFIARFWSQPEMAQKGVDFILAHELAHIYRNDVYLSPEEIAHRRQNNLLAWLSAAVCAAIGILLTTTTLALFVSWLAALTVKEIVLEKLTDRSDRILQKPKEKEADLLAARITGTEGGVYYFDLSRRCNAEKREENRSLRDAYSPEGDYLGDHAHPSLGERVEYLKNMNQFA